jgi:alkaline phosphatase D
MKGTQDEVVIIGSSIQLLSSEHPYGHWGDYPKARARVLRLIAGVRPKLTVILSGDRHLGEISRSDDPGLPYPLYEVTSSGLTHHVDFIYHFRSFFSPETNRYYAGFRTMPRKRQVCGGSSEIKLLSVVMIFGSTRHSPGQKLQRF